MLQSLLPDMEKNCFQRLPSPWCPSVPTSPPQADGAARARRGFSRRAAGLPPYSHLKY